MSTPTPSSVPVVPQKRPLGGPSTPATGGVSTPKAHSTPTNGHLNSVSSPSAQRTIASPARRGAQFAGKSPFSSGTPTKQPSALGSKTLPGSSPAANHPTGSSSGGANGGLMGFDSPANLGLNLGGLGTAMEPGLSGGVGMGITMSSLGLTSSALGRADEEERRRRLEAVVQSLKARPGFVSAESLERLCKRCGLSFLDDARGDGKHTLSMAGETFMLDIDVDPNRTDIIERVSLSFPSSADRIAGHADEAAQLLKRDLQLPGNGPATAMITLAKFANNLETLARLDKLSTAGANCFEAISGVYMSLKRLYNYEKAIADKLFSTEATNDTNRADYEVLCKKSGRPRLHARGRLGLSLDYWVDHHLLPPEKPDHRVDINDAMDIDKTDDTINEESETTFSLIIECEASLPALYSPIRISENWISEDVMKEAEITDTDMNESTTPEKLVDWLEPPPAMITTAQPDPEASQNAFDHSQPRARFVARLEPQIVVPYQIATQMMNSVNVSISQDPSRISTYDSLVLPNTSSSLDTVSVEGETREIHVHRSILIPKEDGFANEEYVLGLFIPKRGVACVLQDVPFEHPRQLIALLPILRQYAFIGSMLRKNFAASPIPPDTSSRTGSHNIRKNEIGPRTIPRSSPASVEDELADLLNLTAREVPRTVDVVFSVLPESQMTFFQPREAGTAMATISVQLNAEMTVEHQSYVPNSSTGTAEINDEEDKGTKGKVAAMGTALATCEDFAIWGEYMRRAHNIEAMS